MDIDYTLLNGGTLAFIGDAYFELCVRRHNLEKGYTNLGKLHNECVKYVSRDNQYKIVQKLELNEEEQEIFKRGRNYDYKVKTVEYINASGFEAIIGYLYLTGQKERLDLLIEESFRIIDGEE